MQMILSNYFFLLMYEHICNDILISSVKCLVFSEKKRKGITFFYAFRF